ncbi:coagulation factor VII-like, partial [Acipenser oxyrinchus oxyrinchus]
VAEKIVHEDYSVNIIDNDIALLKLKTAITYNDYVMPICLPDWHLAVHELASIKFSTVSGWGQYSDNGPTSDYLQRLEVPRIKTQDCKARSNMIITDNMFCAGYIEGWRDSCKGDSGGPHVTKYKNTWFLTGIVSWGKGCAQPSFFGIYTRVSRYLDWLKEHIRLSDMMDYPDLRSRIVGGTVCPKGECPWQVKHSVIVKLLYGLKEEDAELNEICLTKKLQYYGRPVHHLNFSLLRTEQSIPVAEMIIHKKYVAVSADNDIALLRLEKPIIYSDYAVPICLPEKWLAVHELAAIRYSTVSGWGKLSEGGPTSSILLRLEIPRLKTQDCIENSKLNITDNMFCAGYFEGNQDSCKGDSGGPHATKYKNTWFLTGIVSWGKGCARAGQYGIYTRVSRYLDWLKEHMSARTAVNVTVI